MEDTFSAQIQLLKCVKFSDSRTQTTQGATDCLPPFFIRDGTGGNEWLPAQNPPPSCPQSAQAAPLECLFELLPFEEMPQIVNPLGGFFVNANNDPGFFNANNLPKAITLDNGPLNQLRPGGGIFYLTAGYNIGIRAGRITQMIRERLKNGEKISFEDMRAMQADTVLGDAQVFVPSILTAFDNAAKLGADPLLQVRAGFQPAGK
jgi:penicillin amidase